MASLARACGRPSAASEMQHDVRLWRATQNLHPSITYALSKRILTVKQGSFICSLLLPTADRMKFLKHTKLSLFVLPGNAPGRVAPPQVKRRANESEIR